MALLNRHKTAVKIHHGTRLTPALLASRLGLGAEVSNCVREPMSDFSCEVRA
jgi:hypothetical protein